MAIRGKQNGMLQVAVVTVCLDDALAERIARALDAMPWLLDMSHLDSYSSATRRPAFGPQMRAADAGIVFVNYTQNVDQAIDCTNYLMQAFGPKVAVVAVGDDQQPELILEAMRAGSSEYLAAPVTDAVLQATLQRFRQRWTSTSRREEQSGSVLAVMGAKGGVGATTLAVHLAYFLAAQHKKKVLLVDSHPELGHACLLLGLQGAEFTFEEVVRNVNRLDSDLLQGFVGKHSSGLAVLSSPDLSGLQGAVDQAAVAKTMEFLRSEYDFVVVDCDRTFTEATRAIVDFASRIYVVATPEVCAIRDLSRHVERITRSSSEASERIHVVLNRASSQSGLESAQIEKALRVPIALRVPNNYQVLVKSGNVGQPVAPGSGTDVATELQRWANSLVQLPKAAPEPEKKKRGLLSFFTKETVVGQVKGASA